MICEWVYLRSHIAFFLCSSKKGKWSGSEEKLFIFNLPFPFKFYFIIKKKIRHGNRWLFTAKGVSWSQVHCGDHDKEWITRQGLGSLTPSLSYWSSTRSCGLPFRRADLQGAAYKAHCCLQWTTAFRQDCSPVACSSWSIWLPPSDRRTALWFMPAAGCFVAQKVHCTSDLYP